MFKIHRDFLYILYQILKISQGEKMEDKKNNRGGARVGAGRPKGSFKENKKNETFLGYRVTAEEKEKYQGIFDRYKEKYKLSTTKAILKIMDTIEKLEKL